MIFALAVMSVKTDWRKSRCSSWQYAVARKYFIQAHKEWRDSLPLKEREQRRQKTAQQIAIQRQDPAFQAAQKLASSRVMLRNWQNPEFVKAIAESSKRATKERWKNSEFRAKHSARQRHVARANWLNPDIRSRTIRSMKETQSDPEYVAANAKRAKAQWKDPAFCELMSDPEFRQRRAEATAESNRQRVWTSEMTAKRVAKFKAFYDEKRGGPKIKPGKPKGERIGTAKLTEKIVREIRALEGKKSRSQLAEMFGINHWHVRDIQKRRCWQHVE
jgi:hypothetical protein